MSCPGGENVRPEWQFRAVSAKQESDSGQDMPLLWSGEVLYNGGRKYGEAEV